MTGLIEMIIMQCLKDLTKTTSEKMSNMNVIAKQEMHHLSLLNKC